MTLSDRSLDQQDIQETHFDEIPLAEEIEPAAFGIEGLAVDFLGLTRSDQVLDVMCGPGIFTCAFAKTAGKVTGIDSMRGMIDKAAGLRQERKLMNVTLQVGPHTPLPFRAATFDVVFTSFPLHHIKEPVGLLREMGRVCKPDGWVVVCDVLLAQERQQVAYDRIQKMRDPSHVTTFPLWKFEALFKKAELAVVGGMGIRRLVNLEEYIRESRFKAGDEQVFRQLITQDIRDNRSGLRPHRINDEIAFYYPYVLLAGQPLNANGAWVPDDCIDDLETAI